MKSCLSNTLLRGNDQAVKRCTPVIEPAFQSDKLVAPSKTTSSTFTTFSLDSTGYQILRKQHFVTVSSVVVSDSNFELMYFYFSLMHFA